MSNIDIFTLSTGRYYATNCTNLPPNWVAAYLDVERLDDLWCRITAWPPYDGLESPQIIKCYGGTWGSWWVLFASDTIALLGLIGADFLYDPNTDACIVKWSFTSSKALRTLRLYSQPMPCIRIFDLHMVHTRPVQFIAFHWQLIFANIQSFPVSRGNSPTQFTLLWSASLLSLSLASAAWCRHSAHSDLFHFVCLNPRQQPRH